MKGSEAFLNEEKTGGELEQRKRQVGREEAAGELSTRRREEEKLIADHL